MSFLPGAATRVDRRSPATRPVNPAEDLSAHLPILRLTRREFDALPEYSCTVPTGQTIGKRWKRLDGSHDQRFLARGGQPRWMVGEYTRHEIKRDRRVVGDPIPNYGQGPLAHPRCDFELFVVTTWYRPVIALAAEKVAGVRGGVYVASKSAHAPMWQHHRAIGVPIISTWIDEGASGETADWPDLWLRAFAEASGAGALILFRQRDEVLKGAWAEAGAALAAGVPVFAVGVEDFNIRHAPGVTECETLSEAIVRAMAADAAQRRRAQLFGTTTARGVDVRPR